MLRPVLRGILRLWMPRWLLQDLLTVRFIWLRVAWAMAVYLGSHGLAALTVATATSAAPTARRVRDMVFVPGTQGAA